jgi:ABC-type transport system involved in multi-copper enzyme maturation permease subunit
MYVWKLWRDTRARFLGCLVMGLIWAATVAYFQMPYVPAGAVLKTLRHDPKLQQAAWNSLSHALLAPVIIIALLTALSFCELGLGSDLAKGTAELLFTRPRRRAYFSWTAWIFNAYQLLLLMYLMALCGATVLFYMTGAVLSWRPFLLPLLALPSVLLLLGVGYLIVVLTNGRNGASLAFGVLVLYIMILPTLYIRWHFQLPGWWFSTLPWWGQSPGALPRYIVPATIGWSVAALVFPLLAQWSLERKEI